ncbi:MAG: GGDEF domain-containing response regulator [Acidimicrobiia bacterium]
MRQRILVIDDDVDLTSHLGRHLGAGGFVVDVVPDEPAALAAMGERAYDLIILDVMLPHGDGFELLRRIVGDRRRTPVPVIVLTAQRRGADLIRALRFGADDYVVKPFDTDELEARVHTVLRRTGQMRDLSPLTGLPGNRAISVDLERRLATGEPLAVAHVDIDDFKAINDAYGFLRGDGVITFCARCLRIPAAETAEVFVGHVGGDDFVVVLRPSDVDDFFAAVIATWDEGITAFYGAADISRGGITVIDRRGEERLHPIASLSIGVATNTRRRLTSQWEASAIAAEMKEHAKRHPGSNVQVDRRVETPLNGVGGVATMSPSEEPPSGQGEIPDRR